MKITIELSVKEVFDILTSARSHYWAATDVPLAMATNTPVHVFDCDNGELLGILRPEKLRRLELTSGTDGARVVLAAIARGGFGFDMAEADVYVQLALFGEVRYG